VNRQLPLDVGNGKGKWRPGGSRATGQAATATTSELGNGRQSRASAMDTGLGSGPRRRRDHHLRQQVAPYPLNNCLPAAVTTAYSFPGPYRIQA